MRRVWNNGEYIAREVVYGLCKKGIKFVYKGYS